MDFGFTEEQRIFRASVRDFLERERPPGQVRKDDEDERFPIEFFKKMADVGWMGLNVPEKYGGSSGDAIMMTIMLEELGRVDLALASGFYRVSFYGGFLDQMGTEEQKQFFLPKIASGDIMISFSGTEPESGSDLYSLSSSAVIQDDHFIINGQKIFNSFCHFADYAMMASRLSLSPRVNEGISLIMVDLKNTPGIETQPMRKLGLRAAGVGQIFMQDASVPVKNLVGKLHEGYEPLRETLAIERFYQAAQCVGAAQAAIDEALEYAKTRRQFGMQISRFQAISHLLVNMQTQVDCARLLTYRAAWMAKEGIPSAKESTMAKLFATEAYMRVAHDALQVMGGYGYMMDSNMQRHFRDARLFEIAGGTSQIQRVILTGLMVRATKDMFSVI